MLMPADTAQAERACERLRAAVAGDQLRCRADKALYEAKAGGRNQMRLAA